MINLVLYRPQMPANVGNIIRLAANCGAPLHILGPLDFFIDDKRLRRAGLDYFEIANVTYHTSFEVFMQKMQPQRLIAATTHGHVTHSDFAFQEGDYLILGRETSGLPDEVMNLIAPEQRLRIPMMPQSRCLNVSNAAAVIAFEAWRQLKFAGARAQ